MNIPIAIKILQDLMTRLPQVPPEKRREAVMLSIESLKREQHRRKYDIHLPFELLPGETEE